MNMTPRRLLTLLGSAVFVSALSFSPAIAQQAPAPGPQASAQGKAGAQKEQTAKGELQSVDSAKKMLTISMNGKSETFDYNDQTKVTGAQGGSAGLATVSGHDVTVMYTMQGQKRLATSIQVGATHK